VDFGLCLPNFPAGASPGGLEAAGEVAETRLVDGLDDRSRDRQPRGSRRIRPDLTRRHDPAWLGARHPRIRLGTSVIVALQRNAVLLAKELATLDSLSGGRVTAGIAVG
jgi:hypothetical protein